MACVNKSITDLVSPGNIPENVSQYTSSGLLIGCVNLIAL